MDNLRVRFPIEGIKKEVEFDHIPSDIVEKLMQRILSIFLQHKYIKGKGNFGVLTIMDTDLNFKEIGGCNGV